MGTKGKSGGKNKGKKGGKSKGIILPTNALQSVAGELPSVTFTPESLDFEPPESYENVVGGLQGVMDTYKLDSKTLQTVFGDEAKTMFSQDFQRADLRLLQVHSEVQPRKCTMTNMLERVDTLLAAGSWLAQYRAVCVLGTCKNDTENKCRHGEACEGCPQLYLIDGNHRFMALKHIREMNEKPKDCEQSKWDGFRAEGYHLPVDIYHSLPCAVSRLFAFCASEAQVHSALDNSNADKLKFAWEMFALVKAAKVTLKNEQDVKAFVNQTRFAAASKKGGKKGGGPGGVLQWYFRMFRALELLEEGEHTQLVDPSPPLPLLGHGEPLQGNENHARVVTEFLLQLDEIDVNEFMKGMVMKVPDYGGGASQSFLPGARNVQPVFAAKKGASSVRHGERFWIWRFLLWIERIVETERWATPEVKDLVLDSAVKNWVPQPRMEQGENMYKLVRTMEIMWKGVKDRTDMLHPRRGEIMQEAKVEYTASSFEFHKRQCWVSVISVLDAVSLCNWIWFFFKVYILATNLPTDLYQVLLYARDRIGLLDEPIKHVDQVDLEDEVSHEPLIEPSQVEEEGEEDEGVPDEGVVDQEASDDDDDDGVVPIRLTKKTSPMDAGADYSSDKSQATDDDDDDDEDDEDDGDGENDDEEDTGRPKERAVASRKRKAAAVVDYSAAGVPRKGRRKGGGKTSQSELDGIEDAAQIALTQCNLMSTYYSGTKICVYRIEDPHEDRFIKAITKYINISSERLLAYGRPSMIFLRTLEHYTDMLTVATMLRRQLHKIHCESCVVVLECTNGSLGEAVAAFCGMAALELEGGIELNWTVVEDFAFVPTVPEDNKDDVPKLKKIIALTLDRTKLFSRFPALDGREGIYGKVKIVTDPPAALSMEPLTDKKDASPSVRSPYISFLVERYSWPLDVVWDLTGGFNDDRIFSQPKGFAQDPDRSTEVPPLDHTVMMVAGSKNRFCAVFTLRPSEDSNIAAKEGETEWVCDSRKCFLNRILQGKTAEMMGRNSFNHLRSKEPEEVDVDPVIARHTQEDIFALVWDMGLIQHKGARFDGMEFLPRIQDRNPFIAEKFFKMLDVNAEVGKGLFYTGPKTIEAGEHILVIQGVWTSTVSAQRQQESIEVCNNYVLRSQYTTASVFVLGTGSLASYINCYGPAKESDVEVCQKLASEPNVEMTWSHWTPVVKTLKKIKKNEQLLVDYGPIYEWKTNKRYAGPFWNLSLIPPPNGYLQPPPRPEDNPASIQGLISSD